MVSGDVGHRTDYGFVWGPVEVTRLMHVKGRGRVIAIDTGHHRFHVYVSEKGRSVRVRVVNRDGDA